MKRYGLLIVGLFFVSFVSAVPLTGFWGVPWGASTSEIDTIMAQKGYQPAAKAAKGWIYENVSFAGRNGDAFFVLKDAKLAGGSFRFSPKKNIVYDTFKSLKQDLIDK